MCLKYLTRHNNACYNTKNGHKYACGIRNKKSCEIRGKEQARRKIMIEFTSTEIKDGCDTAICIKQSFIKWIIESNDGVCEFLLKDGYASSVLETLDEIKAKLAADTYSGEWQLWWLELQMEENSKPYRILVNKDLVSLVYRDEDLTKVETYIEGAMKCPVFHALNSYKDVKAQMEYRFDSRRKKNPDIGD
jgi:hypothetical protein